MRNNRINFGHFPALWLAVPCGIVLSMAALADGWAALSTATEQVQRMIAEHHFPASEPAMDTQQQFIVFSPDRRLSGELLSVALDFRQEIYRFFGISKVWDQPAFILVFPTRERYGLWGTGAIAAQFRYHGQNVRIIASYLQEGLKERILPHEMVHFLVADLSVVGSAPGGVPPELPIFVNEGIAEYFTAHRARRILFEKDVWEAFQAGKLQPFKEIVTSTASWAEALAPGNDSHVERAQAYSVISFLASLPNGNAKLRNYILSYGTLSSRVSRESASLRAFETAFRQDYSSWEELQYRWMQFIRDGEIVVIEAESASVEDSSGEKCEITSAPGQKLWLSGGKQLLFHASKPGSSLTLHGAIPRPGAYDVYAVYTRRPQGGRFQLALNGKEFLGTFEGYAREESLSEPVYYGKSIIPTEPVALHFSVVGKDAISAGFELGADYILFRRDPRLEERNRTAALGYLQVGADDYRQRRFREAEANFTAAIDLFPGNAAALQWRAYARIAMGKLEEAQRDADAAIKLDPRNPVLAELKNRIEDAKRHSPGSGQ